MVLIDRLDLDDLLRRVCGDRRFVWRPDGCSPVDPLELRLVIQTLFFAEIAWREHESLDPAQRQHELNEEMVLAGFIAAIQHPPLGRVNAPLFAQYLATEIAALSGVTGITSDARLWSLMAAIPSVGSAPTNAELGFLRGWIRHLIAPQRPGTFPVELGSIHSQNGSGEVERMAPATFVAASMTGLSEHRLWLMEGISDEIASVLSEYEFCVYQPIQHTHPLRHPSAAHDAVFVHATDAGHISTTDLVVAVIEGPSLGVGIVCAYAERQRADLVLLVLNPDVAQSPLLLGISSLKRIIPIERVDDIRDALTRYLAEGGYSSLSAHRRLRSNREEIFGTELAQAREAYSGEPRAIIIQRLSTSLPLSRLEEILSSIDMWATKTSEEEHLVRRALRMSDARRPVPVERPSADLARRLDATQVNAWAEFVTSEGLDRDDAIELLRRGVELVGQPRRQLSLRAWRDWRTLYRQS